MGFFDDPWDHKSELRRIAVNVKRLLSENRTILRRLDEMATQDDIQTLADHENADLAAIATDLQAIADAIAAGQKAFSDFVAGLPPGVDLSPLNSAQATLDSAVDKLGTVASSIGTIVVPETVPQASPAPASEPPTPDATPTGDSGAAPSDASAPTGSSDTPPSGSDSGFGG